MNIFSFSFIFFAILWILAIVGWIMNIIKLVGMIGYNDVTTMFIARIVGIFFAPLGCVLGWF